MALKKHRGLMNEWEGSFIESIIMDLRKVQLANLILLYEFD
tara:strand:- start:3591 stop:3713 length:123 start_codon:yes stop_codon:yes gene_type:complete